MKKDENTKLDPTLMIESEILYEKLSLVAEGKLPELAELLVTLSMKIVLENKSKRNVELSELEIKDFIQATNQASSWLDYILGSKRH